MTALACDIPLGLYVHIPWCVRKCPYCDFNSHRAPGDLPEGAYLAALVADFEVELARLAQLGRPLALESIFIGGGTPSLFSPEAIAELLAVVDRRMVVPAQTEITLEANPGTVEAGRFRAFRAAGVNRLSIGVQSFDDDKLSRLGRIHGGREATRAVEIARAAGFERINVDLMYGLPTQTPAQALADIERAIALGPGHISHYQLTLEPHTLFHRHPPPLPDDEATWAMGVACRERLAAAGFVHYEVSAYALPGQRCGHNLNYWRFGDYLGIGAGAHGKLSDPANNRILRRWKLKHPRDYQARVGAATAAVGGEHAVPKAERGLEFAMNALRLVEGVPATLFEARTGVALAHWQSALTCALARSLLTPGPILRATPRGLRFLDDLVAMFDPGVFDPGESTALGAEASRA